MENTKEMKNAKRKPPKDRTLPDYTKGEEMANMTTHICGAVLGILVTVACILVSVSHHNVYGTVSGAIYGTSMTALYTVSSLYHGLKKSKAKVVFRIIDHCTIYFLIAGTYTPILLSALRPDYPAQAWTVFGIEWGIAAFATVFTAIDLKRFGVLSMICYIGMGWCILSVLKITLEAVTLPGFLWLLSGGIAYTVGAVLYKIGAKKRYFHSVFHVFVLLGSVLQAVCILGFVL